MSPGVTKGIGIGSFILSAILLFVAWERYQDNASKVEVINRMTESSPLGGMMKAMTGDVKMEPATPTATKYAIGGAVLAAIGGIVCLVIGGSTSRNNAA
jgi:hypothetical protein